MITDLGASDRASCIEHNKNPRVQALFEECVHICSCSAFPFPSFVYMFAFPHVAVAHCMLAIFGVGCFLFVLYVFSLASVLCLGLASFVAYRFHVF